MARGPCTFKQLDVTRALRATVNAGIEIKRIDIDKAGKITMFTAKADDGDGVTSQPREIVL